MIEAGGFSDEEYSREFFRVITPARNAYLTAASGLQGTLPVRDRNTIYGDIMSAMTTGQLLDYLSVRVNATKADGDNYRINIRITDTGDKTHFQVKNSVILYRVNESSPAADASVEIPRKTLETLALNPAVNPSVVIVTSGDPAVFKKFAGMFDTFDPDFHIAIP